MDIATPTINPPLLHSYRPDIDGLRAVAVLAVVLYHAFPSWLPGGFAGVDIFFVISGYLISSILLSNLGSGSFSLRAFYFRRIKRIFPALTLVMAVCLLLGWYVLLVDEYRQLGKHVLSGAVFVSNLMLWTESGYFDAAAETKPLLHLWSLGIEEQFYIVWPLLLAAAFRWRRSALVPMLLFLVVVSFTWNVSAVYSDPSFAFYFPGARAWELLVGAVVALRLRTHGALVPPDRVKLASFVSILGAAAIVLAIVILSKHHSFPGYWAVLPTAGAAMLISAGPLAWLNRRVLSSRVFVFIGLISFPLYLWHWPLLSFAQILESDVPGPGTRLFLVVLSVILAWLTYQLIEKPLRFGLSSRRVVEGLSVAMLAIAGIGGAALMGGLPPYFTTQGFEKIEAAVGEWTYPEKSFAPLTFMEREFLAAAGGSDRQTVFFGDSTIQQYGARIDELVSTNKELVRTAVFAAGSGCIPLKHVERKGFVGCLDLVPKAIKLAKRPEVDVVVVGALWFSYFTHPEYEYNFDGFSGVLGTSPKARRLAYSALESMLADFANSGKKVYLLLNAPFGKDVDPKFIVKRSFMPLGFALNSTGIDKQEFLAKYGEIHSELTAVASRAGAEVIDPLDFLCDRGHCPSMDDGKPRYMDGGHLRSSYVRSSVTYLNVTLRRPATSP